MLRAVGRDAGGTTQQTEVKLSSGAKARLEHGLYVGAKSSDLLKRNTEQTNGREEVEKESCRSGNDRLLQEFVGVADWDG
jgi:hypothetical protein